MVFGLRKNLRRRVVGEGGLVRLSEHHNIMNACELTTQLPEEPSVLPAHK
jgi:hypothetical protein